MKRGLYGYALLGEGTVVVWRVNGNMIVGNRFVPSQVGRQLSIPRLCLV